MVRIRVKGALRVGTLLIAASVARPVRADEGEHVFRKGEELPPGYYLEERTRKAPLYAGLAVGGGGYLIGAIAAASSGFSRSGTWFLLPIVGPWAYVAENRRRGADTSLGYGEQQTYLNLFALVSGLAQLGGGTLITIGVVATKTWVARDDNSVTTVVVPHLGRNGGTLSFRGTF